jgi:uncharacterized membrane protein YbhN (UPF0104 family)
MAAEQFNDPFWVAIAAAAPIIGLASVVTADQQMRALVRTLDQMITRGRQPPGGLLSAFVFSYVNWFLQAVALLVALLSLGYHFDFLPKGLIVAMEFLGMMLVMMPTVIPMVRTTVQANRLSRGG